MMTNFDTWMRTYREELVKAKTAFPSEYPWPDVLNLPAGNSTWRLSNAISFFAQSPNITPDRRLELQDIAGSLISDQFEHQTAV